MKAILLIVLSLLMVSYIPVSGRKAKKIIISGKVVDAANKPVAGASIFIDKEKTEILTDQNGFYQIKVKPGASEILVLSLLYGAAKEKIDGRTEINFVLKNKPAGSSGLSGKPDTETKGQKDETLTDKNSPGNSGVVNFGSTGPVYQDIYDMIRGRVPGVEVSGKTIRIRGSNSLNVSSDPLFVVDGVIVKDIDYIAPETVKSIEVLKGPDASVYGTRGSNGVILITRRTGKD